MANLKDYKKELQKFFDSKYYTGARNFIVNSISELNENAPKELIAEYYYDLARIEKWNGNYEKATEHIEESIKIYPSVKNYTEYALIHEGKGNIEKALNILLFITNQKSNYAEVNFKIQDLAEKLVSNIQKQQKKDSEFLEEKIIFDEKSKKDFPLISILILGYNNVKFTKKCLDSVIENTQYPNYEIIFLDNASSDETSTIVESYGKKVKYLRAEKNLGFVKGNNYASEFARGEYLVFLNNDTEVTKEWLNSLYNTFVYHPDAGAVGAKLIYPDGKLQEAGGVIFNDATGWNFGKGDAPNFHLYDFTREVDYCSGAALMVRNDIFVKLNGFDERFAPAYYEDTDLCFSVRKLGYKVYYCHSSIVTHYEGATAGTDLNKGFKKYQVINQPKFIEKWKDELKKQYPPDPNLQLQFFNRSKKKKILIIDDIPPLPNQAAGALRHYHTLKQMLNLGYQVVYVHLMGQKYFGTENFEYFHEFKSRGVEFIWFNYEYWWEYRNSPQVITTLKKLIDALELKARKFDYIYIAFWHIAEYFIDLIRSQVPDVPILIDTMDIHFLRELREAKIKNDPKLLAEAKENKKRELAVYNKADCITTVTLKDREVLQKEIPHKPIFILTDVHDPVENVPPFEERKDLLFVGNFNHKPNEDAAVYFTEEIFPKIKEKIPGIKFYIVGSNPTEKVLSLANDSVIVTGWVPKVEPYLNKCRIAVIPLRFGAGNKGKVGQALAFGLPMVTTSVGAEGMGIADGQHAFIADDAETFTQRTIELYNNKNIWEKFSVNGQRLIGTMYTSKLMRKRLDYILSFDTREKLKSQMALEYPEPNYVSVVIPSFNNKEYIEQAVNSIQKNTYAQKEIIIVDNNSDETTKKYLKELSENENVKVIFNAKNEGFPKAVNQGIVAGKGKYFLIANNDVIVPPNAIKRMVEIAESNVEIGIVGVMSNYVSGPQWDEKANYTSPEEMFAYAEKIAKENKNEVLEFPRVAFLFTLVKEEVIEKIGGLDERFSPGNFEDDDFCLRSQLAGFKTVIAKDVFVHHFGSKSFKKDSKTYDELIEKNRKIFAEKWGADTEDIFLRGKEFNRRNIFYPVYSSPFETHFERALILSEEGDLLNAVEEIEKAIEHLENYRGAKFRNIKKSELFNLAGTLNVNIGDFQKAVEYFEKELEETPDSIRPLENIAQTYFKAGVEDVAKEISNAILQLDNKNEIAQTILKS